MKELLGGIVAVILSVFGGHQAVTNPASNAAAAAASVAPSTIVATSSAQNPASVSAQPTIINQPVIERIIERTVLTAAPSGGYVTESEFTTRLNELSDRFGRIISGSTYPAPASTFASGGVWNAIASTNKIDKLSSVTISNSTIDTVSIPDLSAKYLSISSTSTARSTLGISYATDSDFNTRYSIAAWGDSLTAGTGGTPYPTQLSYLNGHYVYNGGVGGNTSTQIKARMLAATDKLSWPIIIWAGRNNYSDSATVQADIASMVAALGSSRYLVLSVLNGDTEPSGSTAYNQIIALNNDLAATYGDHFLDLRSYLVAQYDSAQAQDVIDHANDLPPTSLRYNSVHLNSAGYQKVALYIQQHLSTLIPSSDSASLLTTDNLSFLFQHPATFSQIDTQNGYLQNGVTIVTATGTQTMVGISAGASMSASASNNSIFGYYTGYSNTSGYNNSFFGTGAGYTNTSGNNNTFFGVAAGYNTSTGLSNTFVGSNAGLDNSTGANNTFVGRDSGLSGTSGSSNVAVGREALYANTTGSGNIALGYKAGYSINTGSSNIILGQYVDTPSSTASGRLNIGNVLYGTNLYTTASLSSAPVVNGAIGIGTSSPYAKLSISGNSGDTYNTLFAVSSSTPSATSSLFVILNNGNVGIGTASPSYSLETPGQIRGSILTGTTRFQVSDGTAASPGITFMNDTAGLGIRRISSGKLSLVASGSDVLTVASGNVGVGTTSPFAKFSIHAANGDTNTTLFSIASSTATATTTLFSVSNQGNVTITGSAATCTLGNGASATSCSSSDQRLKDDITAIDASSSLAAVEALRPVSFKWNHWMVGNGAATSTQFGFIAQEIMNTFPNLVTLDAGSHYYKLDYQGLFAPLVGAVQALAQKVADFADSFTTKELTFTRATGDDLTLTHQLCIQKSDGTPVCVTGDQLAAALGGTSTGSSGGSSGPSDSGDTPTSAPDTTPPAITVNGENPAHINVGASYADLGASVTDNVDQNLGLKYFLNGALVSNIVIDTSAAATDTIDYVATDNAGNTSTSTRTVIISSAAQADTATTTTQ